MVSGRHLQAAALLLEAQQLKAQAQQDANLILEDARQQAQQLRLAAGQAAHDTATQELRAAANALTAAAHALATSAASQTTSLACAIAHAILNTELTINPQHIFHLAAQTLAHARIEPSVAIELNPLDAALIRQHLTPIAAAADFTGAITLIERPSLPRASVRVHALHGIYDGAPAARIAQFEAALLAHTPPPSTS